MACPSTNVFICPRDKNKDQHIEEVRKGILEGTGKGLNPEWIKFIKKDDELYSFLLDAVSGLVTYYTDQEGGRVIPVDHKKILSALKYCKPAEVKVIILGHDPVPDLRLATGLAISLPKDVTRENRNSRFGKSGKSVEKVHDALVAAEITPGDSLNHKHWARKGVLLLNACLTLDPDNDENIENTDKNPPEEEKPHFRYWEKFTTRLVIKLLTEVKLPFPTFVLCWGTHAKNIGCLLSFKLPRVTFVNDYDGDHKELLESVGPHRVSKPVVITIGHHPTYPKGKGNKFHTQATNQFKAIKKYPQYSALFDEDPVKKAAAGEANLETKN